MAPSSNTPSKRVTDFAVLSAPELDPDPIETEELGGVAGVRHPTKRVFARSISSR